MNTQGFTRRESVNALYKQAVSAHYWNSFDPERAANVVLDSIESDLRKKEEVIPAEVREDFEKRYLDLASKWLCALSRCASVAVTGPAGFNHKRQRKAEEAERNSRNKLHDFAENFVKRVTRQHRLKGWDEIERLQIKVDKLTNWQTLMKSCNSIIRKKTLTEEEKVDELVMLGMSEDMAKKLLEAPEYSFQRRGFQQYELTNNLARIKQAQSRIDALTKIVTTEDEEVECDWGKIEIDHQDERIRLHFNEIPSEEMRKELKSNGFKWSRMNQAWQRQLTENARRATKRIFNLERL